MAWHNGTEMMMGSSRSVDFKTNSSPGLVLAIIRQTASEQGRLREVPFVEAMMQGTVSLRAYGSWLHGWLPILEGLESAMESCLEPSVRRVWPGAPGRVEGLWEDLEVIDPDGFLCDPRVMAQARAVQDLIIADCLSHPVGLYGHLLAVEYTERVLLGALTREAGYRRLSTASTRFLETEEAHGAMRLREILVSLRELELDGAKTEQVIESSRKCFEGLVGLLSALSVLLEPTYRRCHLAS
jgi:hypothetical protein